jgi:Holliday junction resolvasome RuvABC DNA-binding subunit
MEHYKELMGGLEALGYIETEIKNLLEKNEQEEI